MAINKIMKRDGKVVTFDGEKIADAIYKAAQSVGGNDRNVAEELGQKVLSVLENRSNKQRNYIPTIEEVQDVVEKVLIESGHAKTAKEYILYRQDRSRIREEARKIMSGKYTSMYKKLSLNSLRVLAGRYLIQDSDGRPIESPEEMFERVARALAEVERDYNKDDEDIEKFYHDFREVLMSLEFLPAGRTLTNAGAPTRLVSNCIVLHPVDSMDGIFDTLKDAALLQQAGSGLGFPWHLLRPAGTRTIRSRGVASGPISFLRIYDKAFGTIKQQGRHGANMAVMSVAHPDILEFIHCKAREGDIRNFNISVALTDDFMEKVMTNDPTPWFCEWRGREMKPRRIVRNENDTITSITEETMSARELMDEIVSAAWNNGEPGVIFLDNINRTNPLPQLGRIEACNPCGEQFLHDGDVCNLGSINLDRFVKDGKVEWDRLKHATRTAVRMLDNVIDLTDFPVEKVSRTFRSNRRVGLGIMGFADMLIQLGIGYNTEDGYRTGESVMRFIEETAHTMSRELAEEKGVFPNWQGSVYGQRGIKMRNAALTSIAPTGSISMICDISSGIEPYFALVYAKSQIMGGKTLYYVNRHLEKALKDRGLYSEELMNQISEAGSLQHLDLPEDMKRIFAVALDIEPEGHMRMQSGFQKFVDNSISKTCNFPYEATKDDVRKAYVTGWQYGCKSLTVYRTGSREKEVLHLVKEKKKQDQAVKEHQQTIQPVQKEKVAISVGGLVTKTITNCPECEIAVEHKDGCVSCPSCGWGACS
ncbi:MAG: adenosylcobalamin-dependent ribonucleoside-diphosphate reductase [Candidatus Aenigmarchaeota archaeon]|nr:adenosylcobalamin-dependent ribonucleoside-diphosphate reductase [Candidatus Aenigmarchaeota archaeon]